MLKNKIIALIIAISISLPSFAVTDAFGEKLEPISTDFIETKTQDSNVIDTNAEPELKLPALPEQNFSADSFKKPVSKRKIVKKFILAMFGVLVSSFAIYFGLSLYNRIREGFSQETALIEEDKHLDTPDDIANAIKTFLDKTKW